MPEQERGARRVDGVQMHARRAVRGVEASSSRARYIRERAPDGHIRRACPRDRRILFFGDSFVAGVGDPTGLGWVGRVVAAALRRRPAADGVQPRRATRHVGRRRARAGDAEAQARMNTADGELRRRCSRSGRTTRRSRRPTARRAGCRRRQSRPDDRGGAGDRPWTCSSSGRRRPGSPRRTSAQERSRRASRSSRTTATSRSSRRSQRSARRRAGAREAAAGDGSHPAAGGYAELADLVLNGGFLTWLD